MLRAFDEVSYLPILRIRPGEMRAIGELPDSTKDRLMPFIPLRPWGVSLRLRNSIAKISEVYGDRPVIVGVGDPEPFQDRPVFNELDDLRNPNGNFANWRDFIADEDHSSYVPVVQFSPNILDERVQIETFRDLERGIVFYLPRQRFDGLAALSQQVGALTDGGRAVLFILDWGAVGGDHLQQAALAYGLIATIRENCANATIALSASSFPSDFDGRYNQEIFERRFFNQVRDLGVERIVYSDWGSARVEALGGGGGGKPYPRIDYPLSADWRFFRSSQQDGVAGYQAQAIALSGADVWNPSLRVWGTQMIERTMNGDPSAITNPQRSTAARINLHLQVQSFYDNPELAEDTEDDWDD